MMLPRRSDGILISEPLLFMNRSVCEKQKRVNVPINVYHMKLYQPFLQLVLNRNAYNHVPTP